MYLFTVMIGQDGTDKSIAYNNYINEVTDGNNEPKPGPEESGKYKNESYKCRVSVQIDNIE